MAEVGRTDLGPGVAAVIVDTDPNSVAVDADRGSIIIDETNGQMYRKLDDGPTTNVTDFAERNNVDTVDPTINEDINDGYDFKSIWVNTSTGRVFLCIDNAAGAAIWRDISGSIQVNNFFILAVIFASDADWHNSSPAGLGAGADSNNAAMSVARFDSTTPQNISFERFIPENATRLEIFIVSRAETLPGVAASVALTLAYRQSAPDNVAVPAWSTQALTNIDIPTNTNWQHDEEPALSLATLGITPGLPYQFQLIRQANDVSDTLNGIDWTLYSFKFIFS